jgi:hypothetical protein
MPTTRRLRPIADMIELVAGAEALDCVDPAVLETALSSIHLIRAFEEDVELVGEGMVHAFHIFEHYGRLLHDYRVMIAAAIRRAIDLGQLWSTAV